MAPSLFPQDTITLGLRGWPQRAELVRETVTSALNLPTQTTPYISGLLQALMLITNPPGLCVPLQPPSALSPLQGSRGGSRREGPDLQAGGRGCYKPNSPPASSLLPHILK